MWRLGEAAAGLSLGHLTRGIQDQADGIPIGQLWGRSPLAADPAHYVCASFFAPFFASRISSCTALAKQYGTAAKATAASATCWDADSE